MLEAIAQDKGAFNMHHASKRPSFLWLVFVLLLLDCSACSPGTNTLTSTPTPIPANTIPDISFAFGNHNDVYAAVLYDGGGPRGKSGIAVSKSTDGGKTFGNPVSVFEARPDQIFSDKPWIAVDQTGGPYSGNIYVVWSYDHHG